MDAHNLNLDQVQEMIKTGNFKNAAKILQEMPEEVQTEPLHSTLLGWALFNTGEQGTGINILSTTSKNYPDFFDAHLYKGAALNRCGKLEESLASFQHAENIQPQNYSAKINIGVTCIGLGKLHEAYSAFTKASELAPGNPEAHGYLANVLAEQGSYDEAVHSYQRALKLAPMHAQILINYATVLLGLKRYEEALDLYTRAEQAFASSPRLYKGECKCLLGLEEIEAALELYRMTLNIFPQSSELMEDYCYALAENNLVKQALENCNNFVAKYGANIRMLALKSVLLNEAQEPEQLLKYQDFSSRLQFYQLEAPDASTSKDEFLKNLVNKVLNHPTLVDSPLSHATRSGKHTGELFVGDEYEFTCLKSQLLNAVQSYINEHLDSDDVFSQLKPDSIVIRGWSVVMSTQGHQLSHFHPSAWLSGVCYLQVPDIIGETSEYQGWLEFGSYPPEYRGRRKPAIKLIKPEVGSVVLFPSYFWHRTIPFASDTKRISLAFDVMAK